MTKTVTAMLVAFALAGGSLALGTARADEVTTSTTTTTTSPAFGYEDGYWSRNHAWHNWNAGERETFEKTYRTHYYSGMHTAAPDAGWRQHDLYWESH